MPNGDGVFVRESILPELGDTGTEIQTIETAQRAYFPPEAQDPRPDAYTDVLFCGEDAAAWRAEISAPRAAVAIGAPATIETSDIATCNTEIRSRESDGRPREIAAWLVREAGLTATEPKSRRTVDLVKEVQASTAYKKLKRTPSPNSIERALGRRK